MDTGKDHLSLPPLGSTCSLFTDYSGRRDIFISGIATAIVNKQCRNPVNKSNEILWVILLKKWINELQWQKNMSASWNKELDQWQPAREIRQGNREKWRKSVTCVKMSW